MNIKKYASLPLLALLIFSNINFSFANTSTLKQNRIVGEQRYQTAIEVSKSGWFKADNAVLVSGYDLVSALCSSPLAKLKNAPVLLTEEGKLTNDTKAELIRLGVKNVYLIKSNNNISSSVEQELKSLGINLHTISGNNMYDMSLKVANEINKISKVNKVVIVNGEKGLADATSISGPAAQNNMPIILTSENKGLNYAKNFINNSNIKQKYVIGGEAVIPSYLLNEIGSIERLSGSDRNDTNLKVIEKFYTSGSLNKVFVVKNGMKQSSHLVDAISVGSLAAKESSPILLSGSNLNDNQKNYINKKNIGEIVQVGGGENANTFNQIVSMKGGYLNNLTKKIYLNDARNIILNRFNGGQILYISYDKYDNEYNAKVIHNNRVYEVEVSGYNGNFTDIDFDDDYYDYNNIIGSNNISLTNEAKVRQIVAAKFPGSTIITLKYDREDNEYEIDLKYNNRYYEVTINAFNGSITDFEIDDDYNPIVNTPTTSPNNPVVNKPTTSVNPITSAKAKEVILKRFPGASIYKLEYDRDDYEYEAKLKYKGIYYEVTVNALNGIITDVDIDD